MKDMKKTLQEGASRGLTKWIVAAAISLLAVPLATAEPAVPPRQELPWINDVVKMSAASVPADIIKNYISNSTARSTLRADDIIYLRDHGVASDLISAMIEHGANAPMVAMAQPGPAAAPDYSARAYQQPVAYAAPVSASDYPVYAPYSYSYAYSYPAYYPNTYWFPATSFIVTGFRNNREGFRDNRRFHGSIHGQVGGLHQSFTGSRNVGMTRTVGTARTVGSIGGRRR